MVEWCARNGRCWDFSELSKDGEIMRKWGVDVSFSMIWKWFTSVVVPTGAVFLIWLIAMFLTVMFFGFLFDRHARINGRTIDAPIDETETPIFRALAITATLISVLCLIAILVRAGWIAMLVALAGMLAVGVVAYHMVD